MQVTLWSLWPAILIASFSVFCASSIIWMLLPVHKKDINFLPDEKGFTDAIAPLDIRPGLYMYPNCQTAEEMRSDEFKARFNNGPWGIITVIGQRPNFPKNLLKTYLGFLFITVVVAYLAGVALPIGADYMRVFQIAGAAALLGHCTGGLANDFFLAKPTRFVITGFVDGIIYALITAGVLAAMWPALEPATAPPLGMVHP